MVERVRAISRRQPRARARASSSSRSGGVWSATSAMSPTAFAAEGFVALAPDFFHGAKTDEPDEAMRLLMGLAMDQAAKDIQGAARYLDSRDDVTGNGVGVVGFCMGGSLALWTGALADEVKVAVAFYPGIPWERMSPTWGNYANKSAMIHASEDDGTVCGRRHPDRGQGHRECRWLGRGLRLSRLAPRLLQRRTPRGAQQGARRHRLAANTRPAQRRVSDPPRSAEW